MNDRRSHTAKTPNQKRTSKKAEDILSAVENSSAKDLSAEIAPEVIPPNPRLRLPKSLNPCWAWSGRAFQKPGKEASQEEQLKFVEELIAAGVSIMHRSSSRIARVVKGEQTLEDLKVSKSRKAKTT
jgi:hypothetical protein